MRIVAASYAHSRVVDREPRVPYACSERNEFVHRVPYHLGYGLTYPIALEGALKLKEVTYAHCEGIFSSEFKHGPLSAVHDGYPVLFITAPGDEMMMRGGRAIAVAAEHPALRSNVHDYLVVPDSDRFLSPILATVPAQLVSYFMSVARGIDPDFPRNLSKTLTVD